MKKIMTPSQASGLGRLKREQDAWMKPITKKVKAQGIKQDMIQLNGLFDYMMAPGSVILGDDK